MIIQELQKLANIPEWIPSNTHYVCRIGSVMYGISNDTSDEDLYSWCIPKKEVVFPHLSGYISGFGTKPTTFESCQRHHIEHKNKTYDLNIYSIVKFFDLCFDNNPNVIEVLYCPRQHILHSTEIAEHVREHRHLFLSKKIFHRLKGYSYSQLSKMKSKNPQKGSKRYDDVQKHGFDCKFGVHICRLLLQCQYILENCDLQFDRPDVEFLKAIRRGEVEEQKIYSFFDEKEKTLEGLYRTSKLQYSPDEESIKKVLLECLEMHYGSTDIKLPNQYELAVEQIRKIIHGIK